MHSSQSGGYIVQHGNGSVTHTVNGVTNTYHPPVRTDSPLTSDYQALKAQREKDLAEQAEKTRLRDAENERLAHERRLADQKRQQEQALERQRAEEKARQEQQKLAEEKRLADERRAEQKRQEQALERQRAEEKVRQEQQKFAEEKRLADERLAAEKRQRDQALERQNARDKAAGLGKAKNHHRPDASAVGPHTTFKKNAQGDVSGYAEWSPNTQNPTGFDLRKRVDIEGRPHYNKVSKKEIPTPHVESPDIPGKVRAATQDEIPKRIGR
jgi:hypothetical protein